MKTKKTLLFSRPYIPQHQSNRMSNEGDVANDEKLFYSSTNPKLWFLLENRYAWMNK